MKIKEPNGTWLQQKIASLSDDELRILVNDVCAYRKSGFPDGDSRFSRLSHEVMHHRNENVLPYKLVGEQVLLHAAIRFANKDEAVWIKEPCYVPYCSECGTYSDDADARDGAFCSSCGKRMAKEVLHIRPEDKKIAKKFGKWEYNVKKVNGWICGECGYKRINPIHYCPDCKTDMKLPFAEEK